MKKTAFALTLLLFAGLAQADASSESHARQLQGYEPPATRDKIAVSPQELAPPPAPKSAEERMAADDYAGKVLQMNRKR
ncbi:hypothetical protein [Crenobacter cavernae]|uniref:DUF4148 domain-containing protein n=1 Tax=Crenobacter cavernae TaxID=2290923 RepID=A0A345Y3Z4_9NEIS|nr:hypothetical protein [Crenobacter cavernae]AXK38646.1 hypothetical protein DWG20_03945 [Crenobacter cavernae]